MKVNSDASRYEGYYEDFAGLKQPKNNDDSSAVGASA